MLVRERNGKTAVAKLCMYYVAAVLLTFNSSDNSFSLGNLSPAEKRFSIVIIDNNVSAILCESTLFFMGYITSAFLILYYVRLSASNKIENTIYTAHRLNLECRPPAKHFPGGTTVNPGGLQYINQERYM